VDRVLIGRDEELALLNAWLADRATGIGPPAALVSGEAGIGKTALLRAVNTAAAVVLRAGASPWRTAPFGVLAQLVPDLAATDPDPVRAALLDAADAAPLVVLLDDLHWSDDATLGLLAPLIDSIVADQVAIIGAYRSDELPRGHLLRRLRAELRHRQFLIDVKLGPLDTANVAALIAAVAGGVPDPALVDAVVTRTEGVPFFVEELTAALHSSGRLANEGDRVGLTAGDPLPLPDTVRDAVLLRMSAVSERSRAALDVAAVIGVAFTVSAVTAVTAIEGGEWPDELDTNGLIVATGADDRRFRHALIQEAIYSEVPWSHRRTLHLAVAAGTADPGIAAGHLLAGRDFDRARSALLEAAARHEAGYAYRDAARLLSTALETWPSHVDEPRRLEVIDRLARCGELCGDSTLAVTSLRELAASPRRTGRADVQRRLAVQYELLGHWSPALAAREAAAEAFTDAGRPGEAAIERLAVAAHLRSAASFRAALDMLDAAEADALAAARTDVLCRINGLRGNVLSRMGRGDEGVPVVRAALEQALRHGLSAPAAEVYQRLADSLEHAGDYRAASRAYDSAYEFCQLHDHNAAGQLCHACAAVVLFHSGRWDRALALCSSVLGDVDATAHARAVASGVAGLVHAMRGHAVAARTALLDSQTTARRIELVAMEILATWGLALVDEARGHPLRAAENYRHVLRRCQETEERHYCVPVLQFAAAQFASCDARTDLGATTALLADAAARTGQPEARAAFAYALGESTLAANGDAVPHLRRAIELLDGLDLPIADILVRHRLGVALAGSDDGRTALREAHRTAHRLRARALIDRISADLGSSPLAGDEVLTERERQIMRLVGEGLTSRAIGSQLFLSARTVEMHVRNAVTKLGCRTRAEAVRKLAAR
jgi:DNA-binding CsgD family transcriptional regulator/tetratricopeptide (TPR) repeat protein